MNLNWHTVDRWIMGEAWVGSRMDAHLVELCDNIGPRWSSSAGEWQAVNYIRDQFVAGGLTNATLEEYPLETWKWSRASAQVVEGNQAIALLPFNRCPPFAVQGPIVEVGFGTQREIDEARDQLSGAVAVLALGFEPFTTPVPLAYRLRALAQAGAAAAIVVDRKEGGRKEYHSASDWLEGGLNEHPLPTVTVSREDGARLRKLARQGKQLHLTVESEFYTAPSHNVAAELRGEHWPQEHLLLGGHHDTVYGAPGGNDNGSGTIVVMETARVLAKVEQEMGVRPGRSIRFVTYSAEEQKLQGSYAYVQRHYGPEQPPRLAINLDELATGNLKGIVLGFPHLRTLVQRQLDTLGDGLKCHVQPQLDSSSDHYPFLRAGIDAAFLWRWRFVGRHPDSDFHHEPGDTADKVRVRELKEYVGQLARLLLRLSHVPPEEWPANLVTAEEVQARIERERGQVVRVF
jgi:aminopeptidase YwaD